MQTNVPTCRILAVVEDFNNRQIEVERTIEEAKNVVNVKSRMAVQDLSSDLLEAKGDASILRTRIEFRELGFEQCEIFPRKKQMMMEEEETEEMESKDEQDKEVQKVQREPTIKFLAFLKARFPEVVKIFQEQSHRKDRSNTMVGDGE